MGNKRWQSTTRFIRKCTFKVTELCSLCIFYVSRVVLIGKLQNGDLRGFPPLVYNDVKFEATGTIDVPLAFSMQDAGVHIFEDILTE